MTLNRICVFAEKGPALFTKFPAGEILKGLSDYESADEG